MLVELPRGLQDALYSLSSRISSQALARAASDLSARYRDKEQRGSPIARSPEDIAAYAAYRFPATYAAIYSSFQALKEQRPDWIPRTLLDLGAGMGAGLWAARQPWPGIEQMRAVDAEPAMIASGRELAARSNEDALRSTEWVTADVRDVDLHRAYDLVLIAYVLGEIDRPEISAVIERAWTATRETLVIVEPGTPEGYRRACVARDVVLELGGHEIAPCPHVPRCDVARNDWIHFSVRLPRSKLHREAKGADLNYEDEKFAYVVLSRTPVESGYSRILRHPQIRKGHVHLQLCTPDGVKSVVISKRDGELYRRARKASWGDVFDLPEDRRL